MWALIVVGIIAAAAASICFVVKVKGQPRTVGTWLLLGLVEIVGRLAGWWVDFHRALDGFAREWVDARDERAGIPPPAPTAVERFNEA